MNLLGKVAKEFGEYVAGEDQRGVRSEDAAVEKLLQRVSDGILPDDRREALVQLRDLLTGNPQTQVALGNAGLPALCNVLQNERGDLEMVRGALECLVLAVEPGMTSKGSRAGSSATPGAINAELLVRVPGALALLPGLLQGTPGGPGDDFYVAYHTVQLLTALGAGNMPRLQEAMLAAPMCIARLMDFLGSDHEVLRNEALLLLVGLARASADIQKIVVFDGAFERALGIAREEGGAEGGIVVQDCLELLNNLLRTSATNQLMFRETGHVGALLTLLHMPPPRSARRRGLARQAAANLLAVLETVHLLLAQPASPGGQGKEREANRAANQAALLKGGALDSLLALALGSGGVPSPAVRSQALRCLEELLVSSPGARLALMEASLPLREGGALPALQALLKPALRARTAGERAAAAAVLQAFCSGNIEGQSMLVATVMPVGDEASNDGRSGTFGSELVHALAGPDPLIAARAAAVLRCVLDGNPAGKERVLRIPLELPASTESASPLLLPLCVSRLAAALQSGHGGTSAVVLLRLLITWLSGCPVAATAFLQSNNTLPLLLDVVTGRWGGGDPVISGLAAVLLGTCALPSAHEPGAPAGGAANGAVLDAIAAQVGIGAYFSCIAALRDTPAFAAAAAAQALPQPLTRESAAAATALVDGSSDDDNEGDRPESRSDHEFPLDRAFTTWLPAFESGLRSFVSSNSATSSASAEHTQKAAEGDAQRDTVASLYREVAELQARNRALELSGAASNGAKAPGGAQPGAHSDGGALAVRAAEAEVRAGRAEADAAALREEVDLLQGRYEEAAAGLKSAQARADEAGATASRLEADLEGLSSAYNHLEAHAFALETRVRELEADTKPGGGVSEEEAVRRESAAAEAAALEGEEGLADLLVCLGLEEQKVERLRAKLEELGVDADTLLEGLANDSGEGDLT